MISDGSHIPLGRKYVQCILTPGHTAGSVCYLFQKWLFTGDTLFTEGCGWCRSLGGDAEAIFESVQRLKRLIDNNVKIYPAHSYGQEVGKTMEFLLMNNIYMVIEEKRSLWNSEIGKDKIICLDFNKKQNLRERIGKAHERYCLFVFRPGITVF